MSLPTLQPRGGFFFDYFLKLNIMTKYITRDELADFVEKMWDAGIRVETKPENSTMTLWSKDLDKIEYVDVVDKKTYENLINEIKDSLLPTNEEK
jgi:hypothetical protein